MMQDRKINWKQLALFGLILVVAIVIMVIPMMGGGGKTEEEVEESLNSLSDGELESLLEKERTAIEAVLDEEYAEKGVSKTEYPLEDLQLFGSGEWCGAIIRNYVDESMTNYDEYRAILVKEDGKWELVRYPELVLNYEDYSELPQALVKAVNEL